VSAWVWALVLAWASPLLWAWTSAPGLVLAPGLSLMLACELVKASGPASQSDRESRSAMGEALALVWDSESALVLVSEWERG